MPEVAPYPPRQRWGRDVRYGISEEQQKLLLEHIAKGNVFAVACRAAGVAVDTFYDWLARGGDPQSRAADRVDPEQAVEPYRAFACAVRTAEAMAEARAVEALNGAFDRDWKAAAHWLARRRPADWAEQKTGLAVATTGGVTIYLPDNGRGDAPAEDDDDPAPDP